VLAGRDIVAVDSVGTALMGLAPDAIQTVRRGFERGLGEMRLEAIEIRGDDIKGLKMRYELPAAWLNKTFPDITIAGQDTACSGCIIPLFSALRQIAAENRALEHPLTIALGTAPAARGSGAVLTIGACPACEAEAGYRVGGCPPSRKEITTALREKTVQRG
jgi:hypothetical protein